MRCKGTLMNGSLQLRKHGEHERHDFKIIIDKLAEAQ